jgi:hypothetical protein
MDPMKHSKTILAALVAVATIPVAAHAQSATAQAETLFRQGQELLSKGKFAEACAAFDASQKLEPAIATLLNQASCREKNGQLATAWGLFIDAERQTRSATDASNRQFHRVATDHATKLEPRLSTLSINVPAENRVGGLEVLRNDVPVDPGAWNKPLPVDGGTYLITARAPGNSDWSSSITVGLQHDAKTIEVPKLKAAAIDPRPAAPQSPASQVIPGAPEVHRPIVLPLVLGGAALALAGGALGFELSARSTYDKSEKEEDDRKQGDLYDSANTKRHVAIGFGAASIVCAGAAVWFYLRGGTSEATSTSIQARRLILAPIVGSEQAGFVLTGRY